MHLILLWLASLAWATGVAAEDVEPRTVSLELNTIDTDQGGCRLTFVANTTFEGGIDAAVLEAVLIDTAGTVQLLTLFDFGSLPMGRPRVRQFVVPGQGCDPVGRVLINGFGTCDGPGLTPSVCAGGLRLSSRVDVELIG